MSQNLLSLSITLLIFSLVGCERPSERDLPRSDQKEREDSGPPFVEVETESDHSLQTSAPQIPLTEKPLPVIKAQEKETTKPEPVVPTFSKELLVAVSNWQKIPKSVFPLKSIQLMEDVELEAKTQSGQTLATSFAENGSKVTALGIDDGKLVVANPNNLRLRGSIDLDKSDFKQMVAYLFDFRKRQREKMKPEGVKPTNPQNKKAKPAIVKSVNQEEDFIPDPLDFGHGRFCICKDCREKRLAHTGTLKTGFGTEP